LLATFALCSPTFGVGRRKVGESLLAGNPSDLSGRHRRRVSDANARS
jgi:hypothetical protein